MTPTEKKFVTAVSTACGGPRSTVANTATVPTRLTTALKDANERKCRPVLEALGFIHSDVAGDGGDGNFSSNIYGSKYVHPSGVSVEVTSVFRSGPAMLCVAITNWRDGAIAGY